MKTYEGGTSKGRLDTYHTLRFKKRVSKKVPLNFSKTSNDWVSNPKSQKTRSRNSLSDKQTCSKCGKKYWCECVMETESCFGCGEGSTEGK